MEFDKPQIIQIPKIFDPRGSLSVLQHPGSLPFIPCRTEWLYDIPAGSELEGYATYVAPELIIALSGSFTVTTEGDRGVKQFTLSRPNEALFIPPMTWREFSLFATNSLILKVSSMLYDTDDYIRTRDLFAKLAQDEV